MKNYKPVKFFKDNKAASVPSVWIVKIGNKYKCWWPMYALNKKLRNCVPPPLEVDTQERKKWKLLDCTLLCERGLFK